MPPTWPEVPSSFTPSARSFADPSPAYGQGPVQGVEPPATQYGHGRQGADPLTSDPRTSDPLARPAGTDAFGRPMPESTDPFGRSAPQPPPGGDPFARRADEPSFASSDRFTWPAQDAPFTNPDSFANPDTFGRPAQDPFLRAPQEAPFPGANGYGPDSYRPGPDSFGADPFTRAAQDPFARPAQDPFGSPAQDPFASPTQSVDPFAAPPQSADPFARPAQEPPSRGADQFAWPPQDQPFPGSDTFGRQGQDVRVSGTDPFGRPMTAGDVTLAVTPPHPAQAAAGAVPLAPAPQMQAPPMHASPLDAATMQTPLQAPPGQNGAAPQVPQAMPLSAPPPLAPPLLPHSQPPQQQPAGADDPYRPFVTAGQISGPKTPPAHRQQELWNTVFGENYQAIDEYEDEERGRPVWLFALAGSVAVALIIVLVWAFTAGPLSSSDSPSNSSPTTSASGKPGTTKSTAPQAQTVPGLPTFQGTPSPVSGRLVDKTGGISVARLGGQWQMDSRTAYIQQTYGYSTRQYVSAGMTTRGKPEFAQIMTGPLPQALASRYTTPERLAPVLGAVVTQARNTLFAKGNKVTKVAQQKIARAGLPGLIAAFKIEADKEETTVVVAAVTPKGAQLPTIVYMQVPALKDNLLPDINTVFKSIRAAA
ncbi:hypothetical protein J5X84_23875 [Streptosporangiaceae bacterium NEAU-GS5]|nr:hypothetical protein [Streptosporangiaceae bacterium NEAU-GS5]